MIKGRSNITGRTKQANNKKKEDNMDFASLPIIVVCCYIVGELYKLIFKRKEDPAYKFIPLLLATLGGILGIVIYFTNPEIIFNAENVWVALMIGIVSGVSATGTNQIVKQLFFKQSEVKKDDTASPTDVQSKD